MQQHTCITADARVQIGSLPLPDHTGQRAAGSTRARRRRPRSARRPQSPPDAPFNGAAATEIAELEQLVADVAVEPVKAAPVAHSYPGIAQPGSWREWFWQSELARAARLRPLWEMSPAQRIDAMRRGELTYEQLAAWSARHPEQIPMLDGEFEWIAARMPEVCE